MVVVTWHVDRTSVTVTCNFSNDRNNSYSRYRDTTGTDPQLVDDTMDGSHDIFVICQGLSSTNFNNKRERGRYVLVKSPISI